MYFVNVLYIISKGLFYKRTYCFQNTRILASGLKIGRQNIPSIFSQLKRILQKLKDIQSVLKVCIRYEYQFRLTTRILWNILWARVNISLQNGILTNSFPVTVCIWVFWLSTLKFSHFNRWHKNSEQNICKVLIRLELF